MCMYGRIIGSIDQPISNEIDALHVFVCLLFLKRHKKTDMVNAATDRGIMQRNMKRLQRSSLVIER